jgi:hypothetical protein
MKNLMKNLMNDYKMFSEMQKNKHEYLNEFGKTMQDTNEQFSKEM